MALSIPMPTWRRPAAQETELGRLRRELGEERLRGLQVRIERDSAERRAAAAETALAEFRTEMRDAHAKMRAALTGGTA